MKRRIDGFCAAALLLGTHIRRNIVHASRFHVRTNEFTADLLENRILKAALGLLSRIRLQTPNLSLQVRRTWSAFSEVSSAAVNAADCDRVLYNRLNERYRSPINLARLLLQHLSLEHHTGQTPFATFILPMHDVFERFVARYLAEALASRPRYAVTSQENLWLDIDHSLKGIPDIVLRYDGQPVMVLDTKYKDFRGLPGNQDVYQMTTYGHTLKVDHGVLIYPNADEDRDTSRIGGWNDPDDTVAFIGRILFRVSGALSTICRRVVQEAQAQVIEGKLH